jgi:hypothetical protein
MKIIVKQDIKAGSYYSDESSIVVSGDPDGEVVLTLDMPMYVPPPVDPVAPVDPPTSPPAPAPTPAPQPAPVLSMPPIPVNDNATHAIVASVEDGAGRLYSATATRGNDPTAKGEYKPLLAEDGTPHRVLHAMFRDDGVCVGVTSMLAATDELNCKLTVTYDGEPASVAPSSYKDGHYDFFRGCNNPPCRYGKQLEPDAAMIDRSRLPSYDYSTPQGTYDQSHCDWTFNGRGSATKAYMGDYGERPDIGFLMVAMMAWLLDPTPVNARLLQMTDDWAGAWDIYWRNPETGGIVDTVKYPGAHCMPSAQLGPNTIAAYQGSYNGDTLIKPKSAWMVSACPNGPNGAHLASYGALSAMVCPADFNRDNLSMWANWPLLEVNPGYTVKSGVMMMAQRRAAWCLRSLFLASAYSNDADYFKSQMAKNLALANAIPKDEFGLWDVATVYAGAGSAKGALGLAVWMGNYVMEALDAICPTMPEWKPFAQQCGKFYALVGAMPQAPLMSLYVWIYKGTDGKIVRVLDTDGSVDVTASLLEMIRLSCITGGWTDAQAAAVVAPGVTEQDVFNLIKQAAPYWTGKFSNGVSDFWGAWYSPDSYPAGDIAATIAAANVGTPGIDAALTRVQNLPQPPNYTGNRKYKHVPRPKP